jgi:nucleoside triphosphate diphosphatase
MQSSRDIHRLIEIMAALRDPTGGCPWDLEQTFASIVPFTIEEAYEVADAIERGEMDDLRDELGDLLLQVVFHARMAEEARLFDFGGVVEAITTKLIRRHPHVFGDADSLDSEAVKALWGRIKAEEKRLHIEARASSGLPLEAPSGALGDVPLSLPALSRALKLQTRAAKVGFDWNDVRAALVKLREEIAEVEAEIGGGSSDALSDEVGDLLFAVVNLARHLEVDPETALRAANAKFMRRFTHIETRLAEDGRGPEGADLEEMEALWVEAKRLERIGPDAQSGGSEPASMPAGRQRRSDPAA